jgi:thioredoxin 2
MSANGSSTLTCHLCDQVNQFPKSRLREKLACRVCGTVLVSDSVLDMDAKEFKVAIQGDNIPMVVDFWSEANASARQSSKEFRKAAKSEVVTARFVILNTQDHPGIAEDHKITNVPTLVVFNKGREVGRVTGAFNALEINAFTKICLSLSET